MGLMGRVLGAGGPVRSVGSAVTGVAEVFVGNRAAREAAEHAAFAAAVRQYGAEFATKREGRFDGFMNGLNRLPRPLLVIGTLALFVYAMFEPAGFSVRMEGLALVPDPLWWLLGAIVSFYFGARELHYRRENVVGPVVAAFPASARRPAPAEAETEAAPRDRLPDPAETAAAQDAAAPAPVKADLSVPAAVAPRIRPTAVSPVAVRAADPKFNAAIEEWRRLLA